eukprot:1474682-Pyramimonas_sp.AAC.1
MVTNLLGSMRTSCWIGSVGDGEQGLEDAQHADDAVAAQLRAWWRESPSANGNIGNSPGPRCPVFSCRGCRTHAMHLRRAHIVVVSGAVNVGTRANEKAGPVDHAEVDVGDRVHRGLHLGSQAGRRLVDGVAVIAAVLEGVAALRGVPGAPRRCHSGPGAVLDAAGVPLRVRGLTDVDAQRGAPGCPHVSAVGQHVVVGMAGHV